MTETLTMEDAIAKGYTHFTEKEEGTKVIAFKKITENDRQYYKNNKYCVVDMNDPIHYTIDADTIKDLIIDYVANQDQMADEDDKLCTICEAQNYTQLANELNEKFKVCKFYEPLDIEVIF